MVWISSAGLELKAAWREEWVVNPDRRYTHGGILAAIVDVAADYALAAELGRPVPTIDLRVDYHKAAMPGDLTAKARVVRTRPGHGFAEPRNAVDGHALRIHILVCLEVVLDPAHAPRPRRN